MGRSHADRRRSGPSLLLPLAAVVRLGLAVADLQLQLGQERSGGHLSEEFAPGGLALGGGQQPAVVAGPNDPVGLSPRLSHFGLEIALENVAVAIGDADDLRLRASLGHLAGVPIASQPTEALLLFNGLLAPFGILFLDGTGNGLRGTSPDGDTDDAKGSLSGVTARSG